ncbi:MAG: SpoIID/LytB domain-containing protein [bacterium]
MKRNKTFEQSFFYGFIMIVLMCAGNPVYPQNNSNQAYRWIEKGRYDRAIQLLRTREQTPRVLFWLGYAHFRNGDYEASRSPFKTIQNHYRDHPRYRDALYYLQKLKLYGVKKADIPKIRVKLAEGNRFTGESSQNLTIRSGEREITLPPNNSWKVERVGSIQFRSGKYSLTGEEITIEAPGTMTFRGLDYSGGLRFREHKNRLIVINTLPLNKYLYGVVKKEVAPKWPLEALKAQAVASRSFAQSQSYQHSDRPYDLDATWFSQVYEGKQSEVKRIVAAVDKTRGEVLVYNGRIIPAYFHANSGGHTEQASSVWEGESVPYLTSRRDTWSLNSKFSRWSNSIKLSTINERLGNSGYPPIDSPHTLSISKRFQSGRASEFKYKSSGTYERIHAPDFRLAVGPEILRSTWITSLEVSGSKLEFEGRGWGHGVGMSQWGAYKMAQTGRDYRGILSFYYPRSTLASQFGPSVMAAR